MTSAGESTSVAPIAGPAKWAAVALLAACAGSALTYALVSRGPAPLMLQRPAPTLSSLTPPPHAPDQPTTRDSLAAPPSEKPGSVAGPAALPAVVAAPPETASQPPSEFLTPAEAPRKINLNSATQAELELLPGIGEKTAQRIIAYRVAKGRFMSVAELDKVEGIGPKTLARVARLVTVD